MKKLIGIGVLVWLVVGLLTLGYTQPKIPKEQIPSNIPADVRIQIGGLYSLNPQERVEAMQRLGEMKEKAVPAIPFLIELLEEKSGVETERAGGITFSISEEAAGALAGIGKPAVKPLIEALNSEKQQVRNSASWTLGCIGDPWAIGPIIATIRKLDSNAVAQTLLNLTGQNFGQDPEKWQNWWKQNKEEGKNIRIMQVFTEEDGLYGNVIRRITSGQGKIWVITTKDFWDAPGRICSYNPDRKMWEIVPKSGSDEREMPYGGPLEMKFQDGTLLIAHGQGPWYLRSLDLQTEEWKVFHPIGYPDFRMDYLDVNDKIVCLGNSGKIIQIFNKSDDKWSSLDIGNIISEKEVIFNLCLNEDYLWIGVATIHYDFPSTDGSYIGAGLIRYNMKDDSFRRFTQKDGLSGDLITAMVPEKDKLWVVTGMAGGSGLSYFEKNAQRWESAPLNAYLDGYVAMATDSRSVWVGSLYGKGLVRYDKKTGNVQTIYKLPLIFITSICVYGDDVWVGTNKGLVKLRMSQ